MSWRWHIDSIASFELRRAVEAAAATGRTAFETVHAEPDRNAWWGRLQAGDGDWFVKSRSVTLRRRRLASLVRERGLAAEWRKTVWLGKRGVRCVELTGLAERRRRGMLIESLLIARWEAGARTLADFARRNFPDPAPDLVRRAGALFGELLGAGAVHKQFHPWNVLVVATGAADGAAVDMIPIDLQHLWTPARLTDEDHLWALYQVSFWLHEPVIDWRAPLAEVFLDGALSACAHVVDDPDRLRRRALGLLAEGRAQTKVSRDAFRRMVA